MFDNFKSWQIPVKAVLFVRPNDNDHLRQLFPFDQTMIFVDHFKWIFANNCNTFTLFIFKVRLYSMASKWQSHRSSKKIHWDSEIKIHWSSEISSENYHYQRHKESIKSDIFRIIFLIQHVVSTFKARTMYQRRCKYCALSIWSGNYGNLWKFQSGS